MVLDRTAAALVTYLLINVDDAPEGQQTTNEYGSIILGNVDCGHCKDKGGRRYLTSQYK
jgi:hypothetical protein